MLFRSIPIVFLSGDDPVERGLIASFARPGGNLTGVSFLTVELMPKRLELLSELVPQAGVIALLVNPNNATAERNMRAVQEAARTKGVQLAIVKAGTESEIEAAFATLTQLQAGGLIVWPDPIFGARREQLVALAARHAGPWLRKISATSNAGPDTAAGGYAGGGSFSPVSGVLLPGFFLRGRDSRSSGLSIFAIMPVAT